MEDFLKQYKNDLVPLVLSRNKTYSYKKEKLIKMFQHLEHFKKELEFYEKFEKFNFIPKILFKDEKSKTLIMEHCGEKLHLKQINNNIRKQFLYILETLEKYEIKHNDLTKNKKGSFNNLLLKKKKVYVIDFEYVTIGDEKCEKNKIYNDKDLIKY